MTVCANRPESPGSFTSCVMSIGGCRCGTEVQTELIEQTTTDPTEETTR